METTDEVIEVTDPEAAQLVVRLGGLQNGDWVRFSPRCDEVVSISVSEAGKWHRIKKDPRAGVWQADPANWVFNYERDFEAIDGWRRIVKQP